MWFAYEKGGSGFTLSMYTGGTHALIDAHEKNECVFPPFMFSETGSITISLYTVAKSIKSARSLLVEDDVTYFPSLT